MLVSFLFHVASGQRRPLGAWGTSVEVTQMPLSWQLHAFLRVVRERERRDELESRDEAGGP